MRHKKAKNQQFLHYCTYWPLKQPLNAWTISISLRESNSWCPNFILSPLEASSGISVIDFWDPLFISKKWFTKKKIFFFVTRFWKNLLWQITTIYILKIFHNNFFENLSDRIPSFLSTKKFGLLSTWFIGGAKVRSALLTLALQLLLKQCLF